MKRMNLISVCLTAILLVACTKEVIREIEVPVSTGKESAVKFKLHTSLFTKGTWDHESAVPAMEERRIFNYALLIFHAGGHLEAVMKATPYNSNDPESKGIDIDLTSALAFMDEEGNEQVITLTSGQKQVFALVNAPEPLWNEWIESADQNKTVTGYLDYTLNVGIKGGLNYITDINESPAGEERGFLMTSPEGLTACYLEPTDQNVLDITLSVGRGMAKVSVASDLEVNPRNPEQQPNGELTDITYKVKNNPHEMYVIPSIGTGKQLYTPYFYTQSEGEVNSGLYFESPGTLENNYVPLSKHNALTHLYCMENGNHIPNNQNATQVVIRGTYIPDVLYCADGETIYTGYNKGDDFWRIVEIKDGQRGTYTDKYYGEDPVNSTVNNQRTVKYTNGVTYYFLYLDREETADCPYPYNYTVKRNSYYNIDINKVNNAGDEKENPDMDLPGPGPGPNPGPGPSDEPRITVTLTVQDWDLLQNDSKL